MFRKFIDMPFRKKLLYSFFLLVILSMFVMIMISSTSMMATGRQREIERIENGYRQSLLNVDNYLTRYIDLAQTVRADSYLTNFLNKHYPEGTSDEKRYYDFNAIWKTYSSRFFYEKLSGNIVSVLTDNHELLLITSTFISFSTPETEKMDWYQSTLQSKNDFLLSTPFLQEGRMVIPLTVNMTPRAENNSILLVWIQPANLDRMLALHDKAQEYYLVNESGVILASKDVELIGQTLAEAKCEFLTDRFACANTENLIVENGRTVYMVGRICHDKNLSVCYLIESTVMPTWIQTFFQSVRSCLPLWGIVLILDVLIILLIAGHFSKRMSQLMSDVQQVADGKADSLHILEGGDEFSSLSRYINEMITKVQYFQKESYQANLDKKTAQIRALRSQINPHFLFNCLQAIQTSALKSGAMETSDLVTAYSKMIRENITWTQGLIPLSQELELVQNYLLIQHTRFGQRLDYSIEIDDDSSNAMIPKLTIQPLVENAIHHGMSDSIHILTVYVKIRHVEDDLILTVTDTGKGMDPQKLESIQNMLEDTVFSEPQSHIGILNLQQRIRLQYGEPYGIQIESAPENGAKVKIRLPYRLYDPSADKMPSSLDDVGKP